MGLAKYWIESRNQRTKIDSISTICIIGAFLLFGIEMFVFLPNVSDDPLIMELVLRSVICFVLLISGLVGMLFFGVHIPKPETKGGDIDLVVSSAEWTLILFWMAVDLMFIVVMNIITFQNSALFQASFIHYPDSLVRWMIFSTAIGWTEEVIFRGMMIPAMARASGKVIAVLASTLAWVAFHGGVYGLAPAPLILIFFTGIGLAISFMATDYRLSTPMLPHGLNNFIAVGSRGAILTRTIAITEGMRVLSRCLG